MTRASQIPAHPLAGLGLRWLLALLAAWLVVAPGPALADSAASKEYQIKAACLLNFVQFIEWPAAAFPQPDSPIVIGILGEDPFGDVLERTFADESVQGRSLTIKRSRQLEELKKCHLLFIARAERSRLADILGSLGEANIVTVGDVDEFAQRGGIINFYIDAGKIRFEVNPEAAQRKGLKI